MSADKPLKEGKLHIKQNKFGKKWKRCYALLYPDSSFGVARLEFYDWKDGTLSSEKIQSRKAGDRKVLRLAECIRVAPAPTENGHKENMAAFVIETSEKTMLLSAEPGVCEEWVLRLSEVAFLGNITKPGKDNPDTASLEMAVNSIYVSREEAVAEFRVTVQKTEAAERCSLRGSYILQAESDCLILKDPNTKEALYSWPYRLLRRYGRDKVMFSFEAGRRCSSGAGNFTFETPQGHEIFQKVESSIRAHQGLENRLSFPNPDSDTDGAPQGSGPDSSRYVPALNLSRKDLDDKALTGRVLPSLPAVKSAPPKHLLDPSVPGKSSTPPRSPVPGPSLDNGHSVYSEPKDSVKGSGPHFDPLYSDPVDSVCRKDSRSNKDGLASPLYADLYSQVAYDTVLGSGISKAQGRRREEHIYDEPEVVVSANDPPVLYSEIFVVDEAWKKQANDEKVGHEYPYNPNTDDYSVPNFQRQAGNRPGPKPVPAPKPQGIALAKPIKDPEKSMVTQSNSNNNNSSIEALYSQVVKPANNAKGAKAPAMPNHSPAPSSLDPTNKPQVEPTQPPTNPSQPPPTLPPMKKQALTNQTAPPLPPANKPQASPPPPLGTKPRTLPAKPKSALVPQNAAKSQPIPIPPKNKTLPPLPSPGKPLSDSPDRLDNGAGSPLKREASVIYDDLGIL